MADDSSTTTNRRRRSGRDNLLIVVGVLVVLTAALAIAARDVWTSSEVAPDSAAKPQAAPEPQLTKPSPVEVESNVIDDDGHSMWVSPTDGKPLDLAYLPPGVEIILALRPAKLLTHPESEKVLAALGPWGKKRLAFALHKVPYILELRRAEHLTGGLRFTSNDEWDVTVTAFRSFDESELPVVESAIDNHGGTVVYGREAFSIFTTRHGQMLVGASRFSMGEIIRLDGATPPISRGLERLLPYTDSERDVTILFEPALLFSDSRDIFSNSYSSLSREANDFIGQDVAAAALSLNWGDDFFIEFRAVPTLDSSPERLSERLADQVHAWPEQVEEAVLNLDASPYSRRVVARLPEMMRWLAAYTRSDYDEDCAILRCYLPVAAGHNLLMAGELALAEGQRGPATGVAPTRTNAQKSQTITDRLQKKTTLRFGREELEAALNMLAEDVGVPINIRGRDLQLDGITRNQLFAIDVADRPGEEILVEILRRANPDKTATGPTDLRQKLVYVVGPDSIIITTRAAATTRGETLPAAFQAK